MLGAVSAQTGKLNVQSDKAGLRVYLDFEMIGATPVADYPVDAGEHWVSLFNPDSLEDKYSVLQSRGLGPKLRALWYLARVEQGTARVIVPTGGSENVFLSLRQAERGARRAKWLVGTIVGGPFLLGVGIGLTVGLLAH